MKGSEGFTLLEVLTALVVAGVCLAAIFQTFSQAARLRAKAEEVADSARIAGELLSDEAFLREILSRNGGRGKVPGAADWEFEARVSPLRWAPEGSERALEAADMVTLELCVEQRRQGGVRRCVTGWYPAVR